MKQAEKESGNDIMGRRVEGTRTIFLAGGRMGAGGNDLKVGQVVPSNYFQLSKELMDLIYVAPRDSSWTSR